MGLIGNLFSETETKRNVEKLLESNTNLKTEITNANKNMSSQIANIMMKSMQDMAAGQEITQEISFKNLKADEDINISGISQTAKVKVNLSALQNTELQNEMLEKVQNQLSQGLKEAISNIQTQDKIEGEQWVKEIAGFANNVVQAVVGGDTTENIKETVRNNLNSENIQKNIQEIESYVQSNISNETISKIAADLSVKQGIDFENITSGKNIIITNIDQEVLSEQLLSSVQATGATTKLISEVMGFSETFTEKLISSDQTQSDTKKSTLSGFGDIISGFSGTGGIIAGIVSVVCSLIVLSGMFLMMQQKQQVQTGGFYIKNNTSVLVIIGVVIIFFLLDTLKENFKKTTKILMKYGDKYIYPKDNELYLTNDKNLAGQFDLFVTKHSDQPNTVLIHTNEQYARKVDNKIIFQKFELFDKEKHDFNITELNDTSFELYRENENIIVKNNKLELSLNEKNKFKISLE